MMYLSEAQIGMHLKLKRSLYQFTGIGQYFESKTFNYLTLEKRDTLYQVKLVQVLDYDYGSSPSLNELETVEHIENDSGSIFTGSLKDCLAWSEQEHQCTATQWSLTIIEQYLKTVADGILGQS